MKSYKEIADNVFERREQYEMEKRKKRRILIQMLVPACCLAVVIAGLGVWQSGLPDESPKQTLSDAIVEGTEDWYGPDEDNTDTNTNQNNIVENDNDNDSAIASLDIMGMVIYNGKDYMQKENYSSESELLEDGIVLDEKIGTGNDFLGTYNKKYMKELYEKYERTYDDAYYIEAEVYTIKDNADMLCVVLENGAYIILEVE